MELGQGAVTGIWFRKLGQGSWYQGERELGQSYVDKREHIVSLILIIWGVRCMVSHVTF